MGAVVVVPKNDVINALEVCQSPTTRIRNRALQIFFHFVQGIGKFAFNGLENSLAFDKATVAFVELRR